MKKQISAAVMIFSIIAAPSMAQGVDKQAFEAKVFDVQADKPLQLAELSKKEMKETEGAALWFAPALAVTLGGGAIGAWGNHAHSYARTGQPASVSSTLNATGNGMMVGASLYGAGRVGSVAKNLKFDGPSAGLKYGNGRVFGVRHNSQPVFRVDYHKNPSPTKLHIHSAPNIKAHRPWNAPWKKY
ncbi:hypothetical protein [Neisseria dentiae]|uniref:hypothetical protein n=1 Tax=Neisseria dentiae TaxID=194197 RepID=UPI00359FEE3B